MWGKLMADTRENQEGYVSVHGEPSRDTPEELSESTSAGALMLSKRRTRMGDQRVNLAITAWLHAKFQRSGSAKTRTAYATILGEFRAALAMEGLDLDAADPRRCRADLEDTLEMGAGRLAGMSADSVEDLSAGRAAAIALVAQAYAARPAETRYGPRAVAPTTANLRLAALSSFYTYATRQDLLRGPNPIARVERRQVETYAAARPLAYDELHARLAAIDITDDAGLRDYALLLVALHTGRRVTELAGMRREHLVIRKRSVEITWPRCKGGKTMRDELPRGGARGAAADALVAWVVRVCGERGDGMGNQARDQLAVQIAVAPQAGHPPEQALWVSLARNGTAGHPLTARAIAQMCEKRVGTSKVHALRHTFARAMEDAGAKVSEIQAALGHADLGTTGRYLARLHQGENRHLARLSSLYGLGGLDLRSSAVAQPGAEMDSSTGATPSMEANTPDSL